MISAAGVQIQLPTGFMTVVWVMVVVILGARIFAEVWLKDKRGRRKRQLRSLKQDERRLIGKWKRSGTEEHDSAAPSSVEGDEPRRTDAELTGEIGELKLYNLLMRTLDPAKYRLMRDVYLPMEDGTTTQIDAIVIGQAGIFVVEMKNFKGWIFGNEKDAKWTQTLSLGRGRCEKHSFQNPLRQNYRHICALAECLGIDKSYFRSVIAIGSAAELKGQIATAAEVMEMYAVPRYIDSFAEPQIKFSQLDELAAAISEWQATLTPAQRAAHVANLRANHP